MTNGPEAKYQFLSGMLGERLRGVGANTLANICAERSEYLPAI